MTLNVIKNNFATTEASFSALVSSDFTTAAGNDPAVWNSGTAYAIGDRARVDGTTNKVYQCLVANSNQNPPATVEGATTGTVYWAEVGYTNPYRMFDTRSSSQSTKAASSATVVLMPGRANGIYFGNLDCDSIHVQMHNGATLVYDRTIDLTADNVLDWYDYFMAPIIRNTDAALFDLPAYNSGKITVTYTGGASVAVGVQLAGMFRTMGDVQWQPTTRNMDYSTYADNGFGDVDITERLPARVVEARVFAELPMFNEVNRMASELTGKVNLWSFQGDLYPSLNVLGFPKDFSHVLDSAAGSFFNVTVQGLT